VAERTVSVEFVFDRASCQALAQVYRSLVPERRARTAGGGSTDDDSQAATTSPGGASQLELVARTEADEDRSALGA
jgi:hypothetical protein